MISTFMQNRYSQKTTNGDQGVLRRLNVMHSYILYQKSERSAPVHNTNYMGLTLLKMLYSLGICLSSGIPYAVSAWLIDFVKKVLNKQPFLSYRTFF